MTDGHAFTDRFAVRGSRATTLALVVLIILSIAAAWVRWLDLDELWRDPARWLFEAMRASEGEWPYRDFTWQYPPLSIWILAAAFRLFGATFAVAQVTIVALSMGVVLLAWVLARRLLTPGLAFMVALTVLVAGATNDGNFALFSLRMYSPAIATGAIGVLWCLIGCAELAKGRSRDRFVWVHLVGGVTVAMLSKPEAMLGVGGAFIGAIVVRTLAVSPAERVRTFARTSALGLLLLVPSVIAYAGIASIVGGAALVEGVTGYGMTEDVCPWWPTGAGAAGGALALGAGLLLTMILSLAWMRSLLRDLGALYLVLWAIAIVAGVLLVANTPILTGDFTEQVVYDAPRREILVFLASITALLLPFMWGSVLVAVAALVVGLLMWIRGRGAPVPDHVTAALPLPLASAAIALRGLFGGTLTSGTTVPSLGYPVYIVTAAVLATWALQTLLRRTARRPDAPRVLRPRLERVLVTALCTWLAVRAIAWGYLETGREYYELHTRAGLVRVADAGESGAVYRYLDATTAPGSLLLDVPWGGGMNFALHRPSPTRLTHFAMFAPTPATMQRDLERIVRTPPVAVVARDTAALGAWYGLASPVACTFPRLEWASTEMPHDPATPIPVIEWVERHYAVDRRFDDHLVLRPRFGMFDANGAADSASAEP